MLYYCGRTVVIEPKRKFAVDGIYDTQTNQLNFYTRRKLKDFLLSLRNEEIQGLVWVSHKVSDSFSFDVVSSTGSLRYNAGLSRPTQNLAEGTDIHIEAPVQLGTLRKGMRFTYRNLFVKIITGAVESDEKVVSVEVDFAGLYARGLNRNLTLDEFFVQLKELTTCFIAHNQKLLFWKITLPLGERITTEGLLDLTIGKKVIKQLVNIPIQGAKYFRYSVNDNMACAISSPTRTVQMLDLRNNAEMVNTHLLIESNVVAILQYAGVILVSTSNEDTIAGLSHFFKTSAELSYLGTYPNLDTFMQQSRTKMASYALMHKDKKVFFLANIVDKW